MSKNFRRPVEILSCTVIFLALMTPPSFAQAGNQDSKQVPSCCGPGAPVSYRAVDVTTRSSNINFNSQVGSCSNPGGTCTISTGKSLSTTVGVAFNLSPSVVADKINFSLSATSTTTVGCTSPRLSSGQTFRAFRVGVRRYYRLQKVSGTAVLATSSLLTAWQPYSYTAIHCTIY
jgi:hypothetical protein